MLVYDIDEWNMIYHRDAANQGWCISETAGHSWHAPFEVHLSGDDPDSLDQAGGDEMAIEILRRSFNNKDPHAIAAYELLKKASPGEFSYWKMGKWK